MRVLQRPNPAPATIFSDTTTAPGIPLSLFVPVFVQISLRSGAFIAASAGDTPMALKELEVRYATKRAKDYKLTDGEGLYLLVRPNGFRQWQMKYRYGGKEKLLSFGAYPAVSLAEARLRRAKVKVVPGEGGIPVLPTS
ncbi:Arm DNA-binding domain-containing protein [Sphingomonas sp. Leaf257]|uniref:Arm DNA-binding domain-containing protein n=1 Tax=Sphingomonas sp. Leaf257 TaxID=1736309 RepID=UPI001F2DDA2F|nr:Arm DNA-binding domain-containing protein [Sphingomonas sp. Leaf257]